MKKLCPKRESGGVQCERRLGHKGRCACPRALARWLKAAGKTGIRLVKLELG